MARNPLGGIYYWPADDTSPATYSFFHNYKQYGLRAGVHRVYNDKSTELNPEEIHVGAKVLVMW